MSLDNIFLEKGRETLCISEITVLELYFGAENSEMKEKSLAAVEEFINGLTVLPLSSCVKVYAKEKVILRQIGKPINDKFDLLIASTAKANELILVTDNVKHFKHIQGLRIENWFR